MANLIVDLPRSLAASLLSNYLDEQAISRLDCAFCSVILRSQFLAMLSCDEYKLKVNTLLCHRPSSSTVVGVISYMRWCVTRAAKIDNLHWMADLQSVNETYYAQLLKQSGPHLSTLSVANMKESSLVLVQQISFSGLKSLQWLHSSKRCVELAAILSSAPQLQELELHGYSGSRLPCICGVVCSCVRKAAVSGYASGIDLSWLASTFLNLEELQLRFEDERPINTLNIMTQFPRLRKLQYRMMGTAELLDVGRLAQGCTLLTHLTLENALVVTDDDVEALCSTCTLLQVLEITNSVYMTSESLRSVSAHLASTLQHLSLIFCDDIESFGELQGCTLLEELRIATNGFSNARAEHLDMLFKSCTLLQEVCLDGREVSDCALIALAQHCPHMQRISMVNISGYTRIGLLALAQHLKKLRVLRACETAFTAEVTCVFQSIGCEVELITQGNDALGFTTDW